MVEEYNINIPQNFWMRKKFNRITLLNVHYIYYIYNLDLDGEIISKGDN